MSSQNYNGFKFSGQNSNKLSPAGAQAHLLKRATILKKNLIPPTQQSSILKSFTKSNSVTVMMQTKKLQNNQFSRSICIAP
jgi:hypothetical protein